MAKILVAEDDPSSQLLAVQIVEDMGHTAFVSPNGKHAHETLKVNKDISLLLTDLMMPEMSGQELIKTLRGDIDFMELPIIIMSAVASIGEISDMLKIGATLFMAKPLDHEELQGYITRCLSGLSSNE